uniref:Uncharacterized protein n=1 Tax=Physcomitrium patens TaxID=3218 RepID=A0A7I4A1E7_PHYPA
MIPEVVPCSLFPTRITLNLDQPEANLRKKDASQCPRIRTNHGRIYPKYASEASFLSVAGYSAANWSGRIAGHSDTRPLRSRAVGTGA